MVCVLWYVYYGMHDLHHGMYVTGDINDMHYVLH